MLSVGGRWVPLCALSDCRRGGLLGGFRCSLLGFLAKRLFNRCRFDGGLLLVVLLRRGCNGGVFVVRMRTDDSLLVLLCRLLRFEGFEERCSRGLRGWLRCCN